MQGLLPCYSPPPPPLFFSTLHSFFSSSMRSLSFMDFKTSSFSSLSLSSISNHPISLLTLSSIHLTFLTPIPSFPPCSDSQFFSFLLLPHLITLLSLSPPLSMFGIHVPNQLNRATWHQARNYARLINCHNLWDVITNHSRITCTCYERPPS